MENPRRVLVWCAGLLLVIRAVVGALPAPPALQVAVMPGSMVRGEQLLDDKGCLGCHALDGQGGNRAPDFARSSGKARTPGLFASAMWNHSPEMFREFEAAGRQVPSLSSADVADLFAYFYSRLYFSPQGNAARGRDVFSEKGCVSCHSEVLDTRPNTSALERWTDLKDPITWAERMWNHASEMDTAVANRGIRWPKLTEQNLADLLMFLSKFPETEIQMPAFNLGEPALGRIVFERSCESCHSFGPASGSSRVDLLTRPAPASITGYIVAMWNHAPEMRRRGGGRLQGSMPGTCRT